MMSDMDITGTVPALSILFMALSCLISIGLPIILLIVFKKKGADILPFIVGMAVMVLFAFVLEALVHNVVLNSPAGQKIRGNIWLYALYGGLMAGLFEETGRLAAFKTVLRKRRDKDINALMYGAGHGGIEAAALVGLAMISNIAYSMMINTGSISTLAESVPGDMLVQLQEAVDQLITTPSYMFLMGGIERISAIALHIALSVLVWFATKNRFSAKLFLLAIGIHFAVDAVTVVVSGLGVSTIILEIVVAIMAIAALLIARQVWRSNAVSVEKYALEEEI
jgi:uncharacterized membrane protein YhfC